MLIFSRLYNLVSSGCLSSSTSSLSESSGLQVLPTETVSSVPAAIPTAEDPPAITQLSEDLQGAAQFDQIGLPTTHRAVEATVLGVVQYASSNSSE